MRSGPERDLQDFLRDGELDSRFLECPRMRPLACRWASLRAESPFSAETPGAPFSPGVFDFWGAPSLGWAAI